MQEVKKILNSTKNANMNMDPRTWTVIDSFFKEKNRLVEHQINSFNDFVINKLPRIIAEQSPIVISGGYDEETGKYSAEFHVNFGKSYISKPTVTLNDRNGTIKPMYPNDARLRKLTYSSSLYCDISQKLVTIDVKTGERKEKMFPMNEKVLIGKIPIMLQSKFCILSDKSTKTLVELGESDYDYGGYFIISGSEKVLICRERKCENKVYVFGNKPKDKYTCMAQIASVDKNNSFNKLECRVKITEKSGEYGRTIKVSIARIFKSGSDIPLFVIFRALGIISDKSIIEHIIYNINKPENVPLIDLLRGSLHEAREIQTQDAALEYLSKYIQYSSYYKKNKSIHKKQYITQLLVKNLLPHLGNSSTKKAFFLGLMTNKLLKCITGQMKYDDRDSFINKRVSTAGDLLATLFRQNFAKLIKDIKGSVRRDIDLGFINNSAYTGYNMAQSKISSYVELGMKYAMSTGNWGNKSQTSTASKKGIAQVLSRMSYPDSLSHLRRVNAPLERTGKMISPRKLHNTQWGVICPAESPEGASVGIVKNMALTCYISLETNPAPILEYLEEYGVKYLDYVKPHMISRSVRVLVNGDWVGIHNQPHVFVSRMRELRRKGIINVFTSISWNTHTNEINIFTTSGRLMRPLYIVRDNKIGLTDKLVGELKSRELAWNDLLISGEKEIRSAEKKEVLRKVDKREAILEYIDTDEANGAMIAMTNNNLAINSRKNKFFYNYTHCEIHPTLIFGVVASTIPFANHNQSIRDIFFSAQGKQAVSLYATNYRNRMDTISHVLHYPQKQLSTTKLNKYVQKLPTGQTAIVAIMCYSGYNQEDSLIFNKSAIERGLFVSTYYKTYIDNEKKNPSSLEEERFCKPVKYNPDGSLRTVGMRGSYEHLDENGFVKVNTVIRNGDVMIGKVIPQKITMDNSIRFRDSSTRYKSNSDGIVDKVYVGETDDGYKFCKIKIRSLRRPTIGDKFCSQHGQKGVIGMIYPQEDMPFTKEGIVPDLIVNPHAIPSRMTIGQLIECILGKVSAVNCHESDATPFSGLDVDDIATVLQDKCGYERNGTEIMYNGKTGEQIKSSIFIGPTFYHRLKHMVVDKVHARATGPYNVMTRQPAEGRSRDGGLRIGEMERDAMLSHGTVHFLKEKMFNNADKYVVWVCSKCGMIAIANPVKNIFECKYCVNKTDFKKIHIPYASKLFVQEMMAMGIAPRLMPQ